METKNINNCKTISNCVRSQSTFFLDNKNYNSNMNVGLLFGGLSTCYYFVEGVRGVTHLLKTRLLVQSFIVLSLLIIMDNC